MKIPPHNLVAEQALLGALLQEPEEIPRTRGLIQPPDMHREENEHILCGLYELGHDADLETLHTWLVKHDLLEKSGGDRYLASLVGVGLAAAIPHHAQEIRECSIRRQIILLCSQVADDCHKNGIESAEHVQTLKEGVSRIQSYRTIKSKTPAQLARAVCSEIERRSETGDPYTGVKTGFRNIDTRCWGLEPSTTIYLIARPSIGKTALALNISESVSQHGKVLFYSLESNAEALTRRRVSYLSRISLTALRKAEIGQGGEFTDALSRIQDNENFQIFDDPRLKQVERLVFHVQNIAMDGPISFIVVDHIQRMTTAKRVNSRHLELSWVSEQLSTLSKDIGAPILILCQLARWIEREKVARPQLSAMKESGDLEANADQVWSLYRENKDAELAWVDCLKGRDTGTWTTKLMFKRHIQRFFDCDDTVLEEPDYSEHWQS